MSKIAIKGHASRGKEVIELLEMLGSKNVYNLSGDTSYAYYVYEDGEIRTGTYIYGNEPYTFFTLEEFFEKYPYKIGDKVDYIKYDDEEFSTYEIIGMMWTGSTIEYTLDSFGLTCLTKDIRLHKEKKINQMSLANCDLDEVEIVFGDKFELKIKDGRYYAIKKKQQYPKTYDECCSVLVGREPKAHEISFSKMSLQLVDDNHTNNIAFDAPMIDEINILYRLIMCRNAYWKIAGEDMGLGKPWEPKHEYDEEIFFIYCDRVNGINKGQGFPTDNFCLVFPTAEMRDAFYENFKDLIETCKELL